MLSQLNQQFESAATGKAKGKPTSDVWESLGYDRYLRPDVAEKRKACGKIMADTYEQVKECVNTTSHPAFLIPMFQKVGINGMMIKDHGGPGFTNLE
jgi:DNA-directed RNA polymerase subunit N (RpoN/RPB10)